MSNRAAARLVSVNIGRRKASPQRGKNGSSGIFKTPIEGTLRIDEIEEVEGEAPSRPRWPRQSQQEGVPPPARELRGRPRSGEDARSE